VNSFMAFSWWDEWMGVCETGAAAQARKIEGGGRLHAARAHVGDEVAAECFEAGHRAGTIGQQQQLAHVVLAKVVGDVAHRVGYAVRKGFAGDDDQVGLAQRFDQTTVEHRRWIAGVGNLGLDRGIVLGHRIRTLGHEVHQVEPGSCPAVEGGLHRRMDVVAPGADQAVFGPDDQQIAAAVFQRLDVAQAVRLCQRVAGAPDPAPNVAGTDDGERCRGIALFVAPPGRVRDIDRVVRVERDVDVVELAADPVDERRQTLHVGVGAGDRQRRPDQRPRVCLARRLRVDRQFRLRYVAEVVLRIDGQQVNSLRVAHGDFLLGQPGPPAPFGCHLT
jgi:hypothetical protein